VIQKKEVMNVQQILQQHGFWLLLGGGGKGSSRQDDKAYPFYPFPYFCWENSQDDQPPLTKLLASLVIHVEL